MIYGYARVSTTGQALDGNSLEVQERALRERGAEVIFKDAYTGAKADRPELRKLLDVVKPGDTILVTKLDRVARSISAGVALIDEILAKGVELNVLNMGVVSDTSMGRFMRTILIGAAEFERDMIFERTWEAKQLKRKTDPNYREGRPPRRPKNFPQILKRQKDGEITVEQGCRILDIGRSTWYKLAREHSA